MEPVAEKDRTPIRQTFCCLHSAQAGFFRTDASGVCWDWVSAILAKRVSN